MTSIMATSAKSSSLLNHVSQIPVNNGGISTFSDMLGKQSQEDITEIGLQKDVHTPPTKVNVEKDSRVKAVKSNTRETVDEKEPQEVLEEVTKAAEELASQMLVGLAQKLGISVEEAQMLLDRLGMTAGNLLQVENLTAVISASTGASDPSALLTDENLYNNLQELKGSLVEGLEQISKEMGIESEELVSLIQRELSLEDMPKLAEMQPDLISMDAQTDFDESTISSSRERSEITSQPVHLTETGQGQQDSISLNIVRSEGTDRQETSSENSDASDESAQNMFQQNLLNQLKADQAVNVTSVSYVDPDTEVIMNQIMDFMKVQVRNGVSELEMQLHPENLGTLQVHLSSKNGVLTAQFTTQNDAVKTALESQMVQLKETFNEQGVKVEVIEVTVQSHAFERNMNQGRESNETDTKNPNRSRIRRLKLDELTDDNDDITPEERLAAQIMEQNGNTVDYTA